MNEEEIKKQLDKFMTKIIKNVDNKKRKSNI